MSLNVTFNGSNYIIPETGEVGWGGNTTSYLVAIAAGALQKTGGNFTLSAETDFGASFGLKSLYYKSRSSDIAAAGIVRLANNSDSINWRNAANTADLALFPNASNLLTFNGNTIYTIGAGTITNADISPSAAIAYSKLNLTNSIVNADVNSAAAIAYSKLNLALSIVNADVSTSAAIAYSKLNLSNSIVNADVNASAAIAYSKLNLSNSIVNADINASAAISFSKMTALAANRVPLINASGIITQSDWSFDGATMTTGVGNELRFQDNGGGEYVGIRAPISVTSSYGFFLPASQGGVATLLENDGSGNTSWRSLTNYITNAMINSSAAIAYSKLNLANSIVNADVNSAAAIALSKLAALSVNRIVRTNSSGILAETGWTYGTITANWFESQSSTGIYFRDSGGTNTVGISAPASVTTHAYLLPTAAGTAGQVLSWQTGGQLQWINAAGGGTVNSGVAGFFTYYPANGTTVDDQVVLSTNGTSQVYFIDGTTGVPSISWASDVDTGWCRTASGEIQMVNDAALVWKWNATGQVGTNNDAKIYAADGSLALPAYSFVNDPNTGINSSAVDNLQIVTGGVARWTIDQNGTMFAGTTQGIQFPNGSAATPAMNFAADTDTGWFGLADNSMRLSLGGTQRFIFDAGQFYTPDGSAALPAWTFSADSNTGIYRPSADAISISCGSTQALLVDATSTYHRNGSANTPGMTFIADDNTGIYSVSADVLGFSTGGVKIAQMSSDTLRIENDAAILALYRTSNGRQAYMQVSNVFGGMRLHAGPNGGAETTATAFNFTTDSPVAASSVAQVLANGQWQYTDGSASIPVLSFINDPDTGLYRIGTNNLGITLGGTQRFNLQSTALTLNGSAEAYLYLNRAATTNEGLVVFQTAGANQCAVGMDNDSTNNLCFFTNGNLGTPKGIIDTAGSIAFGPNPVIGPRASFTTTAAEDYRFLIWVNNATGDPFINWSTNATNWSIGIDNSDSDVLNLTEGNSLGGVNTRLRMPTGGQLQMSDGSAAAPQYSFINDTDTGIYRNASNELTISIGATDTFRILPANSANDIRMQVYDHTAGTLKQVSRGATDSGGTGFRVLRIPN